MSKIAKAVAKIASVVAIVASVVAVATGNPALAALLWKVSAIASAVGAVAGTVAQMTAKKPPARGSPNLITIGANQPMPIVLGETYIGGNKVHEVGYGGLVSKVQNPYKFEAIIHSGCGPIHEFTGLYADFATVPLSGTAATGYFAGFLYADRQLGARPEADALAPNWAGAPDWGASHKLSGYAATGLSLKFDKDGKVFASGEPQWGVTLKGVKAYDARLDSTYPGGLGPQRINDRTTWAYSDNPGVVGATYAYGWFHDGKKQGGIGMPVEGIDMARWVEFANVCDANAWKVGGVVYEPGSRWDNLKDICAAGGGEPYFDRHLLGVNYNAPRVSLDTITRDDIADDGFTVSSGRTWRERLNTIAPKYRSAAHKWEYVPSTDVSVAEYITDDGEEKREEITWNLVQNKDQVAQLAAYELVNRREIGQIDVSCKPRLMRYSVGDMLTFNLPGTVIDGLDAIIIRPPEINPETGMVKLTMLGETDAKHAFALGKTATAPPVPALVGTDVLDETISTNNPSGDAGPAGLSNATVFAFRRSASVPATPSVTATYTFATGALTGLNNGWTASVPTTDGNPLYVIAATASSSGTSDTIAGAEWSSPVIQAQDGSGGTGSNGLSTASIFLYQRNNTGTAPAVPTDTLTYTFASGVLSGGSLAGWSRSVPAASGGKYVFITTSTALSASSTDTIGTSEWAAVQILAQSGENGTPGANGTFVHIAYATSADGSTGFSTTDGVGKTYIGTYTDLIEADSTNPALYTWTKIKGDVGDTGATGVSIIKRWQRSPSAPATPSPSTGTPAGWFDNPASATGSNILWATTGERPAGGTNYTWTAPVRDEAVSATITGQFVNLSFTVSSVLSFALPAGASKVASGSASFPSPTGSGQVYVQIESREDGGSWTTSNGFSETYNVGEPVTPTHDITVTNSSSVPRSYEVRGTLVRTNTNSGAVTTSTSKLRI